MASLVEFYRLGGPAMHLILFCLIVGLFLTVKKWLFLTSSQIRSKREVFDRIQEMLVSHQADKAATFTANLQSPIARVIRAGILRHLGGADRLGVETALESAALREIPEFEKNLSHLATLANIATLLGLLGTVSGLIGAFDSVAAVTGAEKATLLSSSIAQAMHTTAFGLIVAIPLLGCYSYLTGLADALTSDTEEAAVMTLDLLKLKIDQ